MGNIRPACRQAGFGSDGCRPVCRQVDSNPAAVTKKPISIDIGFFYFKQDFLVNISFFYN